MSSRAYGYLRVSFILPFAFSAVPFAWSVRPSSFLALSPVTAPVASFARPLALSTIPSPLSWPLLFPPTCFLSFLWSLWSFPVRRTMGPDRYTPFVVAIYSIVHILVGSLQKGGFEGGRRVARAGIWAGAKITSTGNTGRPVSSSLHVG